MKNVHDYTADSLVKIDMPEVASSRMHRLPPYLFGRINALKAEPVSYTHLTLPTN